MGGKRDATTIGHRYEMSCIRSHGKSLTKNLLDQKKRTGEKGSPWRTPHEQEKTPQLSHLLAQINKRIVKSSKSSAQIFHQNQTCETPQ